MINFKEQKGFAAFFITFLIMAIVFSIAVSIFILTHNEQKIIQNIIKSTQSYYAAEAGVEDILLRVISQKNWSSPYNLDVADGSVAITVSDMVGGTRTITAEGEVASRFKKIQILYQITTKKVSFYYGAHVDKGGMVMRGNSKVSGNVFSNGTVACPDVGQRAVITNSLIVAGNGNKIERLEVGDPIILADEASVHKCSGSLIHGTLYYVAADGGGAGDCTADVDIKSLPGHILEQELPLTDAQIQQWKDESSCNNNPACIFNGNYTVPGGALESLGPLKIEGDLSLGNNAVLQMTGTIYATGNIILNQGSAIELDPNIYGSLSGILIADAQIDVQNNATIQGSGEDGSYTILLSTSPSLDENNPAIDVKNSAEGAIFYTSDGIMRLRNNMKIREATGYKIYLDNNAEIEYETGLESASFTSGPGGSWQVTSWREIE